MCKGASDAKRRGGTQHGGATGDKYRAAAQPLLKPPMRLTSPTGEGRTKAFKEDQADTKLSDFSRPVRTMVTSCWSVIGLPKM